MRHLLLPALLFVLLSVASCSHKSSVSQPTDIQVAETLIYNHQDSFYTNPKETEEHLAKALQNLKDSSARSRLKLFIGMSRLFQGDNKGCQKQFEEVDRYRLTHPGDNALAGAYWNDCGIVAMLSGNRDSAITCFENANRDLRLANDTSRTCDVSVNLAGLLRERGDMAKAANVLEEALVMSQGRSKRPATIRFAIQYMLGAVYSDMNSFHLADTYFQQAYSHIADANLQDRYMFFNYRGNRYFFDKKYDLAWKDFTQSKSIARQLNNTVFEAIAESNLGEVLHSQGKNREAMPLLLNAEKTFTQTGAGDPRSSAYLNDLLASTMAHTGDITGARKRFLATDTAAIAGEPRYMMTHYERLADFYRLTGDNALAYTNLEHARHYETEFRNKLFVEQMADAQQRYQRDKKVLSQRAEIQQQKEHVHNLWTLLVVIIVFAVAFIAVVLWSQRRKRQVLRLQFQNRLTELSLQNIRNRLSPHFVMNVLGRELDVNNEGVQRLIKFIRQNLLLVRRTIIPLSEELDFVYTYVELERKSLSGQFRYTMNIDESLDTSAIKIPAMMIQVFVENAVKHGLRGQQGEVWLKVDVVKEAKGVAITIDNNGSDQQQNTTGTHTGLQVVRQTVELLNKYNSEPISLDYGPRKGGLWHVAISIPSGYDYKPLNE